MAERISLRETPVIDAHCFMYQESPLTREALDRLFSLGGLTVGSIDSASLEGWGPEYAESTVPYKRFLKELSTFLSCPPSVDDLLKARKARTNDFEAYARALMDDAGIKTLLVDNGTRGLREVDEFGKGFPGDVSKTFRLETLIRDLLEASDTFESLVSAFDDTLEKAVKVEGCVAFKTIIAYRTGLEVQKVSEADADADFRARGERVMWFGPYVKKVRDYLLRRALVRSSDLGVPLLIHTGLGDTDIIASKCNPALLADILRDEQVLPARVVPIHGGFPYTTEAGWLANVLPNVYFELSSCLPPYLEPAVSARRYGEVLRWVPLPKLIYGSDGGDYPEIIWYNAIAAKRAMAQALGGLVEESLLSPEEAVQEGENIFFNNAKALFRL